METRIDLLEKRVSAIEKRMKMNMSATSKIEILTEAYTQNVEKVNVEPILQKMNRVDIFVGIYVHKVKSVNSKTEIVSGNGYYTHFFVRPYYTIFLVSREYAIFDDSVNLTMNTSDTSNIHLYTNEQKTLSLYFAYSETTSLPEENLFSKRENDAIFFVMNDESKTVSNYLSSRSGEFEVVDKKERVEIYRNKNMNVKDVMTTPSEESFGADEVPHREKPPVYSYD